MATTLPTRVSRGIQTWLRRNPFDNLQEELDQLITQFSTNFDGGTSPEAVRLPSMDVSETEKAFEVKVDVPGFKPEEVQVEMQGDQLLITGNHEEEKEETSKTFHRVERRRGMIRRVLPLPMAVDADKIVAECRNGVLTVTLPKSEVCPTKKIPIKG